MMWCHVSCGYWAGLWFTMLWDTLFQHNRSWRLELNILVWKAVYKLEHSNLWDWHVRKRTFRRIVFVYRKMGRGLLTPLWVCANVSLFVGIGCGHILKSQYFGWEWVAFMAIRGELNCESLSGYQLPTMKSDLSTIKQWIVQVSTFVPWL